MAEPLLDFAEFAPTGPLLEIGCASGSLARAMAQRWPQYAVNGLTSRSLHSYARAQPCAPNLSFEIADIGSLPYKNDSFVGVAAQLVINFVPDLHTTCAGRGCRSHCSLELPADERDLKDRTRACGRPHGHAQTR